MEKYNIEGGIDFFNELYKLLDVEESNFKTEEDNNLCLITHQPLTEYYVEMSCGHKFNYIPLYKDILNHKQKFNSMEGSNTRLNNNEIRCPYCRKKQSSVLPYYKELSLNKITGVNTVEPNYKSNNLSSNKYFGCEFLILNTNYDPSGNETDDFKPQFYKCFSYANPHSKYVSADGLTITNYGDNKCYCLNHQKILIKKYKKDLEYKNKEEIKKTKLKEKEDAKQKLKEEKQKLKEEKQKLKEEKQNLKKITNNFSQDEKGIQNVVLGPSALDMSGNETNKGCIEILKSGLNKGNQCGCSVVTDNLCKRHFKLKNKSNIYGIINNNNNNINIYY